MDWKIVLSYRSLVRRKRRQNLNTPCDRISRLILLVNEVFHFSHNTKLDTRDFLEFSLNLFIFFGIINYRVEPFSPTPHQLRCVPSSYGKMRC